jgi:hypothetical protein
MVQKLWTIDTFPENEAFEMNVVSSQICFLRLA